MDLNIHADAQLIADFELASKRYAAGIVGELLEQDPSLIGAQLHEMLVERAQVAGDK